MMALLRFGALFLVGSVLSSGASRERVEQALDNDIRPLLATYCIRCHGPEVQTVGIDFSVFDDHGSVLRSRPLWLRALRVLRENEMPPAGAQPTTEERRRMVAWIDDAVNNLDWSEHRQPGSVTIPRLNQDEYNNTIRDLTGLDLRPADAFPADGHGESGFRNDRDGLFVAPVLAEKYLRQSRHRYGIVLCFASTVSSDPHRVQHRSPFGQITASNHSRAASSVGNRSASSTSVTPSRCARPGAL